MKGTPLLEKARHNLVDCLNYIKDETIKDDIRSTVNEINAVLVNYTTLEFDCNKQVYARSNVELVKASIQEILDDMGWFENQVFIKSRKTEYISKRQFICYLLAKTYNFKLVHIAGAFHTHDHSLIIHHVNRFSGFVEIGAKHAIEMVEAYNKAQERNNKKYDGE